MNISIVGTAGYVGLVSNARFAEMRVNVTCIDVNGEKINNLLNGKTPIYKPKEMKVNGFEYFCFGRSLL